MDLNGVRPIQQEVEQTLAEWSGKPLEGARLMIQKYGLPDGATRDMLVWYNNGPWKRTIVYRHPVPHNFPMPHPDFLEQTINYAVPPERFDDIAKFDGSVIMDRTKGEVSARCHEEAMNYLTLNLVNDIVTSKRSVEDARKFYAETAMKHSIHYQPTPYTTGLLFPIPQNTADPDVVVVKPR
ncbi:hypothetical protein [Cohnella luojiensis]|uniref:Uncharacterized protein n=1 Tax=Cohnella luojiensis TaxID=652876 RepID=A0A4Y8LQU7_9BACL|nr:hypothetical protein [Cohnella luojiensis]TFE19531.1 hypothetical protein E2980_22860 [Cohnella luojiensis]